MNPEDYVSYPLALALKKHGFDWKCDHYWYKAYANSDEMNMRQASADDFNNDDWNVPHCSAPTLWQAQKWLREVKELIICVEPRFHRGRRPLVGYSFHINEKENRPFTYIESEAPSNTYEEALSAGIAAALELIGEKGE